MEKVNKNTLVVGCSIVILMIIGTVWDFNITDSLNGSGHYFARFFEIFGEFPSLIGPAIGMAYFVATNKIQNKAGRVIAYILQVAVGMLFAFVAFFAIAGYLKPENGNSNGSVGTVGMIVCLIIAIAVFSGLVVAFRKMSDETLKSFRNAALLMIIMSLMTNIGINLIKVVWDRPRYWFIMEYGAATGIGFRPWYVISKLPDVLPEGVSSNAFKSFPSGHTANAFLMLNLTLFFNPIKNKKAYNIAFYFAIVWGACTGLSRLMIGQHFLTDVTVGGAFTIIAFLALKKVLKVSK